MKEIVAVIGASPKEDRYSYKAMKMLMEHGHTAIPISGLGRDILDQKGYRALADLEKSPDTVTMYVGPASQEKIIADILKLKPKRVIFNPGTENAEAYVQLEAAGIKYIEACTLVMLSTDQF